MHSSVEFAHTKTFWYLSSHSTHSYNYLLSLYCIWVWSHDPKILYFLIKYLTTTLSHHQSCIITTVAIDNKPLENVMACFFSQIFDWSSQITQYLTGRARTIFDWASPIPYKLISRGRFRPHFTVHVQAPFASNHWIVTNRYVEKKRYVLVWSRRWIETETARVSEVEGEWVRERGL